MQKNEIKKIALLGSWGLGDFIISIPVLKKVRKAFPGAQITHIGLKTNFRSLYLASPYIDKMIEINKRNLWDLLRNIMTLRRRKFDITVAPFPRWGQAKILTRLIRTKQLFKCKYDIFSKENIVDKEFSVLRQLGIKFTKEEKKLEWPFDIKEYEKKIEFILKQNNTNQNDLLVGIHVGTRKNFSNRLWLTKRWVKVVDYLIKQFMANIVFIGSQDDLRETRNLLSLVKNKSKILNLVGKLNIKETATLINRCRLFISTNSGPMWIAAALGKPQIVLSGPSFVQWNPYNDKAVILKKKILRPGCWPPCSSRKCKYGDKLCMKSINIKEVTFAIKKCLNTTR